MKNKDDERLRKTTIAFLKDFAEKGYENAVECIDWLEKQGEQKYAEKYNITGIGSKNAQGKLGEMIKKLKPVNEVLEQKPADKVEPKFKVGDKIWHKNYKGECIHHIIRIENDNYIGDDNTSISISTADKEYELIEKQGEQKPWSEEDEKYLKLAIENFQTLGNSFLTTWLKNIKDRMQSKQIWKKN